MDKHERQNLNHIKSQPEVQGVNNRLCEGFSILDILDHDHLVDIQYLEMLRQQDPLRQNSAIKAMNYLNSPRGKENMPVISKLIDEPKVVNFILETLNDPKRPRMETQRWNAKTIGNRSERTSTKMRLNKTNNILLRSASNSNSPNSSFIDPKLMEPFQNSKEIILRKRINKYKETCNPSQMYKLMQWLKAKLKEHRGSEKLGNSMTVQILQSINLAFGQVCRFIGQQDHELSNTIEYIQLQYSRVHEDLVQCLINQNMGINKKNENLEYKLNEVIIGYEQRLKQIKLQYENKSKSIVQNFHNCLNLKQEVQEQNVLLQNDLRRERAKLRFAQDGLAKALNILLQIGQNKINFLNIQQQKIIMRMNDSYKSQPQNYRIFYQWCSTVLKIITNMEDQQQQSKSKNQKIAQNKGLEGPGYLEKLALSSIGKFMIDFDSTLSVNDVEKILLNFTDFIPSNNNGLQKESVQESLATNILELHEKNSVLKNENMNKKDEKSSIYYHSGLAPNLRDISEKFKGVNVEVQVVTQIEQDAIGIQVSPQRMQYGILAKPKQKSKETSTQPWMKEKLSINNIQDMDIYIFGERSTENYKPPTSPGSPKRKNNEEIKRKLSILPSMRSSVSSSRRSSKNQEHLSLVVEQLRSKLQKKSRKSQKNGQTLIVPDSSVIQETIQEDKDKSNEIGNVSGRRGSLNRKINKRVTKVEYPPKRVTFIQKNNNQTEQLQQTGKIVLEKVQKSNKMNPKIKISLIQSQSSQKKNEKMLKSMISSINCENQEYESIDDVKHEGQNDINKQIQLLLSKFGNYSEEQESSCLCENQFPQAIEIEELTTVDSNKKDKLKKNKKSQQTLEKFVQEQLLGKGKRESIEHRIKQDRMHVNKVKLSKTSKKNEHNKNKATDKQGSYEEQVKLKQFTFENDSSIGFTFKLAEYFQDKRIKADLTMFSNAQGSEISKMLMKIKAERQRVHSIHITPNELLMFIINEIEPIVQIFLANFQKIIQHESLSPNDLKYKLMEGSQLGYYHSLVPFLFLLIQKIGPNGLTSIGNFWRGVKNLKYSYKNFELYEFLLDGSEIQLDIFTKIVHYLGDGKWMGRDNKLVLFSLVQVQLYFILDGYLTQKQINILILQLRGNKQVVLDNSKLNINEGKISQKSNCDDMNIKSIPQKNNTQDKVSLHTLAIKIFRTISQKKHTLSRKYKSITDLLCQQNDYVDFRDFVYFLEIFPVDKTIRLKITHQFMFYLQNWKMGQERFIFFFHSFHLLSNEALEKNIVFEYFKLKAQKHHKELLIEITKNPEKAIKLIEGQSPMLNRVCQNIISQKNMKINRSLLVLFFEITKEQKIQQKYIPSCINKMFQSPIL